MRIGLYLGRHAGRGGGIGVYARSLLLELVRLLSSPAHHPYELVVYGDTTILDSSVRKELSLAEVLVSETGFGASSSFGRQYRSASGYFRTLPNGARCRVLLRLLSSPFGRKAAAAADQCLLPLLLRLDGVELLHSLANVGVAAARCPQLITMHDLYQAWPQTADGESKGSAVNKLYRRMFRRQCRSAAGVITDARHVADEVVRRLGIDRVRVSVIPLGLDRHFLRYMHGSAVPAVPPAGLPESERFILMFASADPRKNIKRTLEAWRELPGDLQGQPLVAVSPQGEARRAVQRYCRKHGAGRPVECIDWLEREALPELYRRSAAVLVPTLAEGFGFPAVEAYALGVPVVSGPVEYLSGKGPEEGVFCCDPRSVSQISAALASALAVSAAEMPGRTPFGMREVRSMADAARETLALYAESGLRYRI